MEVDLGGWIWAIVIGGLAGWAASIVTRRDASMGVLANVLVGIIGAAIGNLLFPYLGMEGTDGPTIWSFVVALIGAVILLLIIGLFRRPR